MTLQHEQRRNGPRGLATVSLPRFPLRERHNPPAAPPKKKSSFLGLTKSLPSPKDPVPDSPTDYTELWEAVRMTKPPSTAKSNQTPSSNKGTEAYSTILNLLGIDLEMTNPTGSPDEIIDL